MEKRNKIICLVLSVLLIVFIGYKYYINNYKNKEIPPANLKHDYNSKYDFVDNEVMISFYKKTTDSEKEAFINKRTDIVDKKELGKNGYLLILDHSFNNRNELVNYCKQLIFESGGIVEYCEANNIIKLDDCSKGPC